MTVRSFPESLSRRSMPDSRLMMLKNEMAPSYVASIAQEPARLACCVFAGVVGFVEASVRALEVPGPLYVMLCPV